MALTLIPMSFADVNEFVDRHHRHHGKVVGHKFSIGVCDELGDVHGVAIVGRPVSRMLDDGWTLEVTRCCTDGAHNAASMLYGAAWRGAKALGYKRLVTYTLEGEAGDTLVASGWYKTGDSKGGSWDRRSRPRVDKHPVLMKVRWEPRGSECGFEKP